MQTLLMLPSRERHWKLGLGRWEGVTSGPWYIVLHEAPLAQES